ncbi:phosphatase PAP2 family protein [Nocardioides sp. Kera G14]|uniref:phosphatase PAP2 family protein n=1 Tax=Nocardioides sp. Kera G14 TaxID=2884264 RepID=UPI001D1263F5|nr:phosphatase PAP2 family protein [Nocardioides sp. Kera G14]UDY23960.1 phosphatase PAP2 family protein [Nocardioides sp. Kera G14]
MSMTAVTRAPWARPMVEFAGLIAMGAAYTLIRAQQGTDPGQAFAHSAAIFSHEHWLFEHLELPFNHWMAATTLVAVPACYFYAVFHYVMTPFVFVMSWRAGGWVYRRGYWTLVIASGVALVLYATYAAAPPRLMPELGSIDVLRRFADYGWWGEAASAPRAIGDATNQYAAMPSLHFGWSLWCAIQMWSFGGRTWRTVAVLYPTVQVLVVIGTANHYLGDVLVGGLCVLAAEGIVLAVRRVARVRGARLVLNTGSP